MSAPMDLAGYVTKAATDYATEFRIPLDEVREWYRNSTDKPGLIEYMIKMVQVERDWRQHVADEYHARTTTA
jgi:hypothetical protein